MFYAPTETQRQIADIQQERKLALIDLGKARSAADWLKNPRSLHRYRGKADRLALEQGQAAAHVARQERRLADLDARLAELVARANSE